MSKFVENNNEEKEEQETVLTGQVILDDESMETLTKQIREQVMLDIKDSGLYHDEGIEWLKQLGFNGYYNALSLTLKTVLDRVDAKKDIVFKDEQDRYSKLEIIKSLLELK